MGALAATPLLVNVYSQRSFDPDKTAVLNLLALVMATAWLIRLAAGGRVGLAVSSEAPTDGASRRLWWLVLVPILLYGLSLIVSSLISIDPRLSWSGSYHRAQGTWSQLGYLAIFAAMLAHLRQGAQARRLIFVVVSTSLLAALYGVLQHLGRDPVQWLLPHDRAGSTLGNPVFFAAFLVMAIFLTLEALWRSRSKVGRTGALLYVLLMQLTALAAAQSRGPIVGLLAGFIVAAVLARTLRRKAKSESTGRRWAVAISVGTLVLVTLGVTGSSPSRLSGLLDPTSPTARVRLLIWQGAAGIVASNQPLLADGETVDRWHRLRPWFGHGPETFALAFHRFHSPELARLERPDRSRPHGFDVQCCGLAP